MDRVNAEGVQEIEMTHARPGCWRTNGPLDATAGSFAHRTVKLRLPKILQETVRELPALPAEQRAACDALFAELTGGVLRGLTEHAPDRAAWDLACAPHLGHKWLDLPWYFAESYFYRRILEATGFFQPGPTQGADPFLPAKLKEEATLLARVAAAQVESVDVARALRLSLWGNRADLSYTAGRAHGDAGSEQDLLIDDSFRFIEMLHSAHRAALLLDNAGTELGFDLVLARTLRARGLEVVLYAKPQPFFVSDATPADVQRTAALLEIAAGEVRTHAFFASSGFLRLEEIPSELRNDLSGFDVVIAKGDANYRRLVGDAPWPNETPMAAAISFPCPVLALRTMKAEVLVGVDAQTCARARALDADWMVSGRFGLIALS
jgi:uncharacterized protein with ATP-grasp and redox domains